MQSAAARDFPVNNTVLTFLLYTSIQAITDIPKASKQSKGLQISAIVMCHCAFNLAACGSCICFERDLCATKANIWPHTRVLNRTRHAVCRFPA